MENGLKLERCFEIIEPGDGAHYNHDQWVIGMGQGCAVGNPSSQSNSKDALPC